MCGWNAIFYFFPFFECDRETLPPPALAILYTWYHAFLFSWKLCSVSVRVGHRRVSCVGAVGHTIAYGITCCLRPTKVSYEALFSAMPLSGETGNEVRFLLLFDD